ncbi:DUF2845 domain-containing protein [Candidatus Binatia bacterium]|nr:DUF2845 domain-containing protein [Candidatus Binatia bacterium]
MRRTTMVVGGLIATLVLASGARAQQLDCGGRFVENGMSIAQVLDLCGEPQQRTRSERTLTTGLLDSPGSEILTIPVEVWTYSPPGQFSRKVVFESGRVVKTETGGYADLPPQF